MSDNGPVSIEGQPAVVTAAPSDAEQIETTDGEHGLALYTSESTGLFYGICSCGGFVASHHADRQRLEQLHSDHVERSVTGDDDG